MEDQGHIRLKEFISDTYLKQLIYKSIEDQVLQVYREDHQPTIPSGLFNTYNKSSYNKHPLKGWWMDSERFRLNSSMIGRVNEESPTQGGAMDY